ncbi:TlpA family protein disulfide reductase [Arachidicoccus ginsenosidimutans]|uniref:TlpA family protein disulfide reductase n=1 Tax=Arachidicoccus sp. BS20 TaxID=1850526 RepID=UPI0018D32A5C|nr:TlpA disulfide reductase family protein [Arachidicoccus sp. BS20]
MLNYITPVPPAHIRFDNKSKDDTIITAYINLNKITEFFYLDDSLDTKGKPVLNFRYILIFPGDSICIDKIQKNIAYSTNGTPYINSIMQIPSYANLLSNPQRKDNPYRKGLKSLLDTTDKIYNFNTKKIANANLNNQSKDALNKINLLEKYFQIYNMINVGNLKENELRIMDSVNNAVLRDSSIFSINSPNAYAIIENMIQISARKNGANLGNFWNYFTKTDNNIKQFHFYKYYTFLKIIGSFFNNFDGKHNEFSIPSLQSIHQSLSANKDSGNLKDSLIKFTNILLETKTNYALAKEDLNNFDNGKYDYLFEDDYKANHEKKNINSLVNVVLDNFNSSTQDFQQVVKDKNYKLTVVDFWASWCEPCLKETPEYLKIKNELKNQSIKFVGISIDTKEDAGKWIAAAKAHGLNDTLQYRLENYQRSPLTSLLQINTIPRYIVFDNEGNVVVESLDRPSSGKFKTILLKYLNR